MPVRPELIEMAAEMRLWRRHLHACPETAYEERNTSDFIAQRLAEWGIDVYRGLAVTGVVGTLKAGTRERVIALRADMDALHIEERNEFDHRSRVKGKMHACGHDGHMAMLLGAACHLARTRHFDGTIRFIFQPAEENEAGAQRMIKEGLFELFPVDAVYGMHNMPIIPEGKMVVRPGAMMASADFFEVIVTGKGAHGAWPHAGIDVIGVASEIVLGFNHIIARTVNPLEAAVISITQFNAGHTTNVLPETAMLAGTTRTFSVATQDHLELRMRQICDGIAAAHGAKATFKYQRRYPPTVNHAKETEFAAEVAARVVGVHNVLRDEPPVMGAEDFAWMLLEKPGSYVWIGNGPEHQGGCMLHNSGYDFNDSILPIGASYWVELVESGLAVTVARR
jgi:hippurate hydrolase